MIDRQTGLPSVGSVSLENPDWPLLLRGARREERRAVVVMGHSSAAEPTGAALWAAPGPGRVRKWEAEGAWGSWARVSREGRAGGHGLFGKVVEGEAGGCQSGCRAVRETRASGSRSTRAACGQTARGACCVRELGLSLREPPLSEQDWPNGQNCRTKARFLPWKEEREFLTEQC